MNEKHDHLSPYLARFVHLTGRCTNPLCPRCGDERDTSIDRNRLRRERPSLVGSAFIGVVGALGGLWLLGAL